MKSLPQVILTIVIGSLLLSACNNENYSPRPKGYYRIDLPSKSFKDFRTACPFSFEYHSGAEILYENKGPCWFNIEYPGLHATIHLSYKEIAPDSGNKQLIQYAEDSRSLVYKHTVKATDIIEHRIRDDSSKVFGLLYLLEGNAASSMQFYLTDSAHHFLRGALYFNVSTNVDSLYPVIKYIQEDIHHLVSTFEWESNP